MTTYRAIPPLGVIDWTPDDDAVMSYSGWLLPYRVPVEGAGIRGRVMSRLWREALAGGYRDTDGCPMLVPHGTHCTQR